MGLTLQRNKANGLVRYLLTTFEYEKKREYGRGGGGMRHRGSTPATFIDVANRGKFRDFCGVICYLKEVLIDSWRSLQFYKYPTLNGEEWTRTLSRIFDDIPLALGLASSNAKRKRDIDKLVENALRSSLRGARHYLFSLPPKLMKELRQKKASRKLRETFKKYEYNLPKQCEVQPINRGEWTISGERREYIIKKDGNKQLNVYVSFGNMGAVGCDLSNSVAPLKLQKGILFLRQKLRGVPIPPPKVEPPSSNPIIGTKKVGEKSRIVIPDDERKLWDVQKGEDVSLARTPRGIEIRFGDSARSSRSMESLGNIAEIVRELSVFFFLLKDKLFFESQIGFEGIRALKDDFAQALTILSHIPQSKLLLLLSVFGEPWISRISCVLTAQIK